VIFEEVAVVWASLLSVGVIARVTVTSSLGAQGGSRRWLRSNRSIQHAPAPERGDDTIVRPKFSEKQVDRGQRCLLAHVWPARCEACPPFGVALVQPRLHFGRPRSDMPLNVAGR